MSDWWAADPVAPAKAAALVPGHRDLAIRTIYGEAANEPDEGQAAVAAVIRNRMQAGRYGKDIPGVVLAKNQFEPWGNTEARARMSALKPDDPRYQKIGGIVDQMFSGEMPDPTNGSTHFFSPTAQAALGRNVPAWAQGDGQPIGRHTFFAPEGRVQSTDISAQRATNNWWSSDPVSPPSQVTAPPESSPQMPPAGSGGRFTDTAGESFRTAREGISETAPPKTTALEAGARGIANTVNLYDELRGLMEAGGLNPKDPASLSSLLSGAYKYWTGDPAAEKTYNQTFARESALTKKAEEDQPVASIAGNIAGGIALPLGTAARGASLADRTTQGARVGAAIGGLSGVGAGDDTASRVTGGAMGTAAGAVIGAAAPAAVEGVVQGARGLAAPFGQAAQALRGIRDPEAEAARRVTGALQRDASVSGGPPGISPAEFAASRNAGGSAAIMDLGGETTRGLARSAANTSPEGRAVLNKAISDRFESQSERVAGWLDQSFGPVNTGATREALQTAARNANQPAYSKAFAQGRVGIWDQDLAELAQAPIMQDAIKAATKQALNRSAPDVGKGGDLSARWVTNGKPTLEFWDLVKRQVDQEINVAKRAGRSEDVMEATRIKDLLVTGKLDQAVPSYQAARAGAAKFFGANDALEAGEKFLTSNAPLNEARRALGQMSQPERDLFREGFVQSLVSKIEATGDRRNVLNSIAQSPKAQQQIEMVMGPQKAREFEAMLRVEGVMDMARSAVQGNSTTARQLTELGLAGGTYGIGTGGNVLDPNPTAMMSAALVYGVAKGKGAIDQRVSRKVAEMLISNDPNVLRKGIQIVSRNRSALDSLRAFDVSVARSGAQQSPGLPALQSMGIGRAEDDQPSGNMTPDLPMADPTDRAALSRLGPDVVFQDANGKRFRTYSPNSQQ